MGRERQEKILDYMRTHNQFVTVVQLCTLLFISGATARRELQELQNSGLIKRTRGGAVLIEGKADEDPLTLRENQNVMEKEILASLALREIPDGSTIFLDSSSSAYVLAHRLTSFRNLRVITNGLKAASFLAERTGVAVMCTGGTVRKNTKSLVGPAARQYIESFYADIAILSCRGFVAGKGAFEASEEECAIKKLYLQNSSRHILLCTPDKLGKEYLCHIGKEEMFDSIITG